MMRSTPFMMTVKIPFDVSEGQEHTDKQGEKFKITKIKSVKFLDMRTMQVIGLGKPL